MDWFICVIFVICGSVFTLSVFVDYRIRFAYPACVLVIEIRLQAVSYSERCLCLWLLFIRLRAGSEKLMMSLWLQQPLIPFYCVRW